MKYLMSQLEDLFAGRPAAVLGGGPSLPGDMERLPEGCVLIAVNEHASRICEPDFVVFNDNPTQHDELMAIVSRTETPIPAFPLKGEGRNLPVRVSEHQDYSDVQMDVHPWSYCYSSTMATWLACWMGCNPVLLCGMDCYQGNQVYFHEHEGEVPALNFGLDFHLRPWIEEGRYKLPHVERVKAMSGPLGGVFGIYEGDLTPTLP